MKAGGFRFEPSLGLQSERPVCCAHPMPPWRHQRATSVYDIKDMMRYQPRILKLHIRPPFEEDPQTQLRPKVSSQHIHPSGFKIPVCEQRSHLIHPPGQKTQSCVWVGYAAYLEEKCRISLRRSDNSFEPIRAPVAVVADNKNCDSPR